MMAPKHRSRVAPNGEVIEIEPGRSRTLLFVAEPVCRMEERLHNLNTAATSDSSPLLPTHRAHTASSVVFAPAAVAAPRPQPASFVQLSDHTPVDMASRRGVSKRPAPSEG